MGARLRRISAELAKFSAVNVVATVVAIVLFNLSSNINVDRLESVPSWGLA